MNTDKIYAESIANEYSVKKASKIIALKKLDRKVKKPANVFAFSFGILSALILGTGMSLSLRVIGSGTLSFTFGILLGLIGIVGVSVNYFLYKKLLEKRKSKYAADVLRIAKEISEDL